MARVRAGRPRSRAAAVSSAGGRTRYDGAVRSLCDRLSILAAACVVVGGLALGACAGGPGSPADPTTPEAPRTEEAVTDAAVATGTHVAISAPAATDAPVAADAPVATDARGELRLQVIDVDGSPVAGMRVVTTTCDGAEHPGVSGADGRIVFPRVPAGDAFMALDLAGWREMFTGSEQFVRLPCAFECVLVVPPVARVRGRVVDSEGRPVPGARVGFGWRGYLDLLVATDADGHYEAAYSRQHVGTKSAHSAWAPGYTPNFGPLPRYAPGLVEQRDFVRARAPHGEVSGWAETFVEFGSESLRDDLDGPQPGLRRSVAGRVVDERGVPIIGARISLGSLGQSARSDADGRFVVRAPDTWDQVQIHAPGFLRRDLGLEKDAQALGEIVLMRRLDVAVRFVFADDGAPVVGAIVRIAHDVVALTGSDGGVVLRGADATSLSDGAEVYIEPGRLDLPQPVATWRGPVGARGRHELAVERGGRIAGRVVGSDGEPLVWVTVRAEDVPYDGVERAAWTDLSGRFVLAGQPRDRPLRLTLWNSHEAPGYAVMVLPDARAGRDVALELQFPLAVKTSGRLLLPDIDRWKSETILAVPLAPFPERLQPLRLTVQVDSDGAFEFLGVPRVRYRLALDHDERYMRRLSVPGTDSDGSNADNSAEAIVTAGQADIVVEAFRADTITGRLVDRWGPVEGAEVSARDPAGEWNWVDATTDADGHFEIGGLEPGLTYRMRYRKTEHHQILRLDPIPAGTRDRLIEVP